jgi:hypothetical protein
MNMKETTSQTAVNDESDEESTAVFKYQISPDSKKGP